MVLIFEIEFLSSVILSLISDFICDLNFVIESESSDFLGDDGLSIGVKVGIGVGVVLGVFGIVVFIGVFIMFWRRWMRNGLGSEYER